MSTKNKDIKANYLLNNQNCGGGAYTNALFGLVKLDGPLHIAVILKKKRKKKEIELKRPANRA